LISEHYEIVDKRIEKPVEFPHLSLNSQKIKRLFFFEIKDNSIINAWANWCKTFTGLAIAGIEPGIIEGTIITKQPLNGNK